MRDRFVPRRGSSFVPLRRTVHLRIRLGTGVRRCSRRMLVARRRLRRTIHVRSVVGWRLIVWFRPIRLRRRLLIAYRRLERTVVRAIIRRRLVWLRTISGIWLVRLRSIRFRPIVRLRRRWTIIPGRRFEWTIQSGLRTIFRLIWLRTVSGLIGLRAVVRHRWIPGLRPIRRTIVHARTFVRGRRIARMIPDRRKWRRSRRRSSDHSRSR